MSAYNQGVDARKSGHDYYSAPYAVRSKARIEWCAGWNDEDIRIAGTRYFVNDSNSLVRTDDTGKYKPLGDWREVTLTEWDDFRAETKLKGKRK